MRVFVREGWMNRDTGKVSDPRTQFNNVQLLHDVMEQYAKKLTIMVDIKELQEKRIQIMEDVFKNHEGTCTLNFLIKDTKDKISVQMPSRKQKVKISSELLNVLGENDFQYRLN